MTWFLTSLSLVVLSFMQVESINSIICLFVSSSTGDSSLTMDDAYNFRVKKAGSSFNSRYAGSLRILHIYPLHGGWLQ